MTDRTPTGDRLLAYLERIERIREEITGLRADEKDVFNEAKAEGFDTGTMRRQLERRKLNPADRQEADAMLETYEAAIASPDPASEALTDMRLDAAELAHAILAEQIEGIADVEQAQRLIEHVIALLDIRAEVAAMREVEADRKKLAKGEGFEVKQVSATVRWFEKCAKHGEEVMRAGEAVYLLYRGTMDRHRQSAVPTQVTQDSVLASHFPAPAPKKVSARDRRMAETMIWAGKASE